MTALQAVSLGIFVAILAISIRFRINIGVVALPGVLLLAAIAGMGVKALLQAFPGNLSILVIGITLLFAHVQHSGAIDWLIGYAVRRVGFRRWIVPWLGFILAAILGTVGGLPATVVAIVIPIVAGLARSYRIDYFMMAVITNWAAIAAGMSPLSPSGALLITEAHRTHLSYSPWALYGIVMAMLTVASLIVFFAYGGARLYKQAYASEAQTVGEGTGSVAAMSHPVDDEAAVVINPDSRVNIRRPYRIASLLALLILLITTVGLQVNVGLAALSLALLLQIIFRPPEKEMLGRVAWPVVLLLAGLLIYLHLLQKIGTLHAIQSALHGIGSPAIMLLVLAYITTLFSNLDSSTIVVIGVMAPIGLTVIGGSPSALLAVLVTVAAATAIISMSPVHIDGSLIIANTPNNDETQLFRRLIFLAVVVSLVAPALLAIYPIIVR